jgi:hypothetical protein
MEFCVINRNTVGPHLYLVWWALSYWGSTLVSFPCTNVIVFDNVSSIGQTRTIVDMANNVHSAEIRINTMIINTNALAYNVLLHEVGHANGFHHSSGLLAMKYTLIYENGRLRRCVPYLTNVNVYIPLAPCDNISYSGLYTL